MIRGKVGNIVAAVGVIVAAGSLAACVREGPPLPEQPKAIPEQPAGIQPDRAALFAQQVGEDTDGDDYPDRFVATLLFFNNRYSPSLKVHGVLELELKAEDEVLARWAFGPEELAELGRPVPSGWGYPLVLNLDEGGTDELTAGRARLVGRMVPLSGGMPVVVRGATLMVGK